MRSRLTLLALSLSLVLPALSQAQGPDLSSGREAFEHGRYEEAVSILREVVAQQPDDPDARYDLARAHQALGQDKEAIQVLEDLLANHPEYEPARFPLGVSYYRLKRYRQARTQFEQVARAEVDRALLSYYQGLVAFKLGEYDVAPPKLLRALTLAPELGLTSHYYSGVAYYKRKEWEEAREAFLEVKDLAPGTGMSSLADDFLKKIALREQGIKPWSLFATLGIQVDSNVVLQATTSSALPEGISRKSDTRYLGVLRGGYQPIRTDRWIVDTAYMFYQNLHHKIQQFNVQNHSAQVSATYLHPRAQVRLQYALDLVLLSDERFSLVHTLNPMVVRPWGARATVQLQYRYQAKDFKNTSAIPANDERDGSNHLVGLNATRAYAEGRGNLRGGYSYDTESARATDWEADAHRVTIGLGVPPLRGGWAEPRRRVYVQTVCQPALITPDDGGAAAGRGAHRHRDAIQDGEKAH